MSLFGSPGRFHAACAAVSILLLLAMGGTAAATDLSGSWRGEWSSHTTGHHGPLRCTLTLLSDGSYQARFAGRFFKIIPFRYSVILYVTSDDGHTVQLSGSQQLGRRFGTFTYTAHATCDELVADYDSCKDSGQFSLTRCGR